MSVESDNSQQEYTAQCSSFLLFESLFSNQNALKIDLLLRPGLSSQKKTVTLLMLLVSKELLKFEELINGTAVNSFTHAILNTIVRTH